MNSTEVNNHHPETVRISSLEENRNLNCESTSACKELVDRFKVVHESGGRDANMSSKRLKISADSHHPGIRVNFGDKYENNHECGMNDGEKKWPNPMTPLDYNTVSRNKIAPSSPQNNSGYMYMGDSKAILDISNDQENSNSFYDYIGVVNRQSQPQFNDQSNEENHSLIDDFKKNHYLKPSPSYSRQILEGHSLNYAGNDSRPESNSSTETQTTSSSPSDNSLANRSSNGNFSQEPDSGNSISPTTRDGSLVDGTLSTDSNFDSFTDQSKRGHSEDFLEQKRRRYKETLDFLNCNDLIGVTLKTADLLKRNQLLQKDIDHLRDEVAKVIPSLMV